MLHPVKVPSSEGEAETMGREENICACQRVHKGASYPPSASTVPTPASGLGGDLVGRHCHSTEQGNSAVGERGSGLRWAGPREVALGVF